MGKGEIAFVLILILYAITFIVPKTDALETQIEFDKITTELFVADLFGNSTGSLNITNITGNTAWNASEIVDSFISNILTITGGSVNGSIIDNGVIADARLSSNILFTNGSRNVSGDLQFNSNIGLILDGGNITSVSGSAICIGNCSS